MFRVLLAPRMQNGSQEFQSSLMINKLNVSADFAISFHMLEAKILHICLCVGSTRYKNARVASLSIIKSN